ncbi:hypothetical protein M9458_015250, partial [Cirrhinus mrigala]
HAWIYFVFCLNKCLLHLDPPLLCYLDHTLRNTRPNMDPAVRIMCLRQGDCCLEDYVHNFVVLANLATMEEIPLMIFFRGGLAEPLSSLMPLHDPSWTLETYINLALQLSGSAFFVGVAEEQRGTSATTTIETVCKMAVISGLGHDSSDLPEPGQVTAELPEPGQVTVELPEPSHVTVELPEPSHVTIEPLEPGQVTAELPEPGQVTVELPEPSHVTVELPEPGQVTAELPEPGQVTAELPEPGQVTAELPEPGQVTAELPEQSQVTVELPEPSHVTIELLEPGQVTAELPEPGQVTIELLEPCHTSADLPEPILVSLASSLEDPPLVSTHSADLPVPSAAPWWASALSALLWGVPVPSALPWWASVPSAPPWWVSAPSWGSSDSSPLLWCFPTPPVLPASSWLPARPVPPQSPGPPLHGPGPPSLTLFTLHSISLLDFCVFVECLEATPLKGGYVMIPVYVSL